MENNISSISSLTSLSVDCLIDLLLRRYFCYHERSLQSFRFQRTDCRKTKCATYAAPFWGFFFFFFPLRGAVPAKEDEIQFLDVYRWRPKLFVWATLDASVIETPFFPPPVFHPIPSSRLLLLTIHINSLKHLICFSALQIHHGKTLL